MAAALTFAGCGGGERQDAGDTDASYRVELVRASFPERQHIADETEMQISVRNTGDRTIPNLTATVEGDREGTQAVSFADLDHQPGLASRSRAVWIVDAGPHNGDTAYANTWALGALRPGRTADFVWRVTAIRSGRFRLNYRIAGSLPGGGKVIDADGDPVAGDFDVNIAREPAQARVTADGDVVRLPSR